MAGDRDKINPYESPRGEPLQPKVSALRLVLRAFWPAIRLGSIGAILGVAFGAVAFSMDQSGNLSYLAGLVAEPSIAGYITVCVAAGLVIGSLGGFLIIALNAIRRPKPK